MFDYNIIRIHGLVRVTTTAASHDGSADATAEHAVAGAPEVAPLRAVRPILVSGDRSIDRFVIGCKSTSSASSSSRPTPCSRSLANNSVSDHKSFAECENCVAFPG